MQTRYQIEMRLRALVRVLAPATSDGAGVALYRQEAPQVATALRRAGRQCDATLLATASAMLTALETFVAGHLRDQEYQRGVFQIAMSLGEADVNAPE